MLLYSFDDSVNIFKYINVRKTQDGKSQHLKILISFQILLDPIIFIMLSTIYFQNELCLWTIKVHDVIPDIFLPVELTIADLLSSDLRPDELLGVGRIASQIPGERFKFSVERQQSENPPSPSFRKGGN